MNAFDRRRPKRVTRADQKEATARAVLAAARVEFELVGFDAANLRAIAARAGVSAGTVIHHHGDKRELLHAALFDDLERAIGGVLASLGGGPLESELHAVSEALFGYYELRPRLSRTLLKESLFAEEPWAGKFKAQVSTTHQALVRLLEEAAERGEVRDRANGPLFAMAYLSFFYFALIGWVQGAPGSPVALVDHLVGQHLEGLRPTATRSSRRHR